MIHNTNIKTVPALVIALLLPCCACSCAYRDGMKSLATPGDLFTCSHEQQVCRGIPCDPCYGFHPTCWTAWSDCCTRCPPPSDATAQDLSGGGKNASATDSPSPRELVPTPQEEPPVAKPPRQPQAKPPAVESPDAPLPPPKDTAVPPSNGVTNFPPPPASFSENVDDPNVLGVLRLAISSRSSLSRPLEIPNDPSLEKAHSPRWEDTIIPRFCYYEPMVDYTYHDSAAASFARDLIEP
jgi:hypothetical protein